eukprot:TRINITY_DN8608_c0_g2_i1.p1 TRINITY_DN8608_c0_g2~~TRINITY_DN8608_c0_g2_i1.p1  ORF type:complete len:303 (-),score=6.36 TRINITY_DN8608_c0_g2_i1:770-1678(-)
MARLLAPSCRLILAVIALHALLPPSGARDASTVHRVTNADVATSASDALSASAAVQASHKMITRRLSDEGSRPLQPSVALRRELFGNGEFINRVAGKVAGANGETSYKPANASTANQPQKGSKGMIGSILTKIPFLKRPSIEITHIGVDGLRVFVAPDASSIFRFGLFLAGRLRVAGRIGNPNGFPLHLNDLLTEIDYDGKIVGNNKIGLLIAQPLRNTSFAARVAVKNFPMLTATYAALNAIKKRQIALNGVLSGAIRIRIRGIKLPVVKVGLGCNLVLDPVPPVKLVHNDCGTLQFSVKI